MGYSRITSAVIIVFAILFEGTNALQAQSYTSTVESTPGLMAFYQFSGNTNSSVNAYTGSLTSGASIDVPGSGPLVVPDPNDPSNQALKLNGTSGNELLSSLSSGVSNSGSVLAWINLAELPSTAGRIFYIAGESAEGDDLDLQIQTDNNIYFYTDSGGSVSTLAPLTSATLDTWMFVAATFTASSDRSLYINGVLDNTDVPGSHYDSGNQFTIGYSNVFGDRSFDGDIGQVAFYNTDLTSAQVAAIYASSAGIVVPEPASLALLGMMGIGLFARRRGRDHAQLPTQQR